MILAKRRAGLWGAAAGPTDPDAIAYIAAVEAADVAAIEPAVKLAIDALVIGLKADGVWSAIKAMVLLCGARTLAGALVPLVGPSPTNSGFTGGNYNRKNGLTTSTTAQHLVPGRAANAEPQNNRHIAVYRSAVGGDMIGIGTGFGSGASNLYWGSGGALLFPMIANSQFGVTPSTVSSGAMGFWGLSRGSSSLATLVRPGSVDSLSGASQSPTSSAYRIFQFSNGSGGTIGHRLNFYSLGENLNLSLLKNRVDTYISDLQSAIP